MFGYNRTGKAHDRLCLVNLRTLSASSSVKNPNSRAPITTMNVSPRMCASSDPPMRKHATSIRSSRPVRLLVVPWIEGGTPKENDIL